MSLLILSCLLSTCPRIHQVTVNSTEKRKEYSISFEDRETYLYASVAGAKETLSIAHAYWSEIAERAISSDIKKVLVFEDFPEVISIAEVHQLVSEFSELPITNIRLAFVDPHPQHKSLNEFAVLVGSNRGLTIEAFDTVEEAEKWLLGDQAA